MENGHRKETPSWCRIGTTSGGIFMARSYGHIKMYENVIFKLKKQGVTNRTIIFSPLNCLKIWFAYTLATAYKKKSLIYTVFIMLL